ncbi:bifunctional 3-demethylubiquinone-9 3-methyltransferase/ 2-octaprenyl-6-hydroxy phenol methylase [Roseovarius gaetbuli]|uniref:Bifunctional 3-demethylubiquinone-9 3-methyltransferase/ 2-octaprenyl-6-hydroxy phenol methylase n=1 Tax=Roseovarius gaetbuli TaxID=1356575 RepID=A0A1X6YTV5_9RHOB|nr:class I SAM-dependent methyltransferase [Roseovarius gaetbuli]SLN30699.1 bifunctional 3-demethylubiquinone-9 3-methyltransferase/ 2-octaprenyl-6-hydroxy phenol methylase [Roseovarius gaetbuli]
MTPDSETLRVYDAMADQYATVTADAASDPLLAGFIGALPRGAQVLDLGCGPGIIAAHMARAGLSVTATDASREMVALTGGFSGVTARLATFDEIAGEDIYDGIWANFSLLHAARADMPRHLNALHVALKPGGILHIALKSGTGASRDSLGRLYTYYTAVELETLLIAAGFTPFSSATGRDTGLSGEMADWIAISAHG